MRKHIKDTFDYQYYGCELLLQRRRKKQNYKRRNRKAIKALKSYRPSQLNESTTTDTELFQALESNEY